MLRVLQQIVALTTKTVCNFCFVLDRLKEIAIAAQVLSRSELAERLQVDPARITRGFQKVEELIKINQKVSLTHDA